MKNNKLGLKVMAALLAVAIVGSFAITTKSNNLRAMEGDEGFVEEAPAEVVQEVFVEPEPEIIPEEPAEQPAEEAPAEEPAEQPAEEAEAEAEEEEPFDVVAAYEHYMSLDEYGKIEYLNSLSDANREELKRYIEMKEAEAKAAEEPKEEEKQEEPAEEPEEEKQEEKPVIDTSKMSLKIWDDRRPSMDVGETVTLYSELHGFEGINFSYRWQCNKGNGWEDVPGGNGATYSFNASVDSLSWSWRLLIDF